MIGPSHCWKNLLAGCSKDLRAEARDKSPNGGVLSEYVEVRRLNATMDMSLFSSLLVYRAFPGRKVGFEITGEEFERAFNRRTGHVDQITKSFAFVEGQNLAKLFKDRFVALP